MSKVVFNPTNEDFEILFQGIPVKIKGAHFDQEKKQLVGGQKIKMDDARANHCLHELGRRGLCQLEYGDDEDMVAKEGIRRNIEFKQEQVGRFNQDNEQRQQTNRPYVKPPSHVVQYAEELGLTLIKPHQTVDPSKAKEQALREENAELKQIVSDQQKQMNNLSRQMEQVLTALQSGKAPEGVTLPEPTDKDELNADECIAEFKMMNRAEFAPWVRENRERIETWPMDAQDQVRLKWSKFYDKEFPF